VETSDVLRQLDRNKALRRQSVMRARRESASGFDHAHHSGEDDSKPHPDDEEDEEEDEGDKKANGIGTGRMRYQYMTPDDFGDDVPMRVADILNAFKGLSSTHGIPHVTNARGKHNCKVFTYNK